MVLHLINLVLISSWIYYLFICDKDCCVVALLIPNFKPSSCLSFPSAKVTGVSGLAGFCSGRGGVSYLPPMDDPLWLHVSSSQVILQDWTGHLAGWWNKDLLGFNLEGGMSA